MIEIKKFFLALGNENLENDIENLDIEILDKTNDLEVLYDLLEYIEVDFIVLNRLLDDDEAGNIKKISKRSKSKNAKIILLSDDFKSYEERKLITTLVGYDVNVFLKFSEVYKIEKSIESYPKEFDFNILSPEVEEKSIPIVPKVNQSSYIDQITKGFKRIIGVASFAQTGKSYIASNLAYTLSKEGIKTALVDADFKNRALSYYFNIWDEKKNAYINILDDLNENKFKSINDYCFSSMNGNLNILTNTKYDEDSESIDFDIDLEHFIKIIDYLRVENEIVIIDMSSILNEYSKRILNLVDTVLFVQNLDYRMMDLNKSKLKKLDRNILKKMILVINRYVENKDLSEKLIRDFFEIDFIDESLVVENHIGAVKQIRYGKSFIEENEESLKSFKNLSQFCYGTEIVEKKKGLFKIFSF